MNSQIIINADDLGMRHSINSSVRELLSLGLISSASIIVNHDAAAFDEAAGIAHDFAPCAGFGLHLDLDNFFPFDSTGHFGLNEQDIPDGFHETILARSIEISADIRCQFEKLLKAGVFITHVDGHHNAHLFPAIFEMLEPQMLEFGVSAIRFCDEFFQSDESRQRVQALMEESEIEGTNHFFDLSHLMHPEALETLPEGTTEIMVHTDAPGSHEQWRAGQHRFLIEHEEEIRKLQLINYGEV